MAKQIIRMGPRRTIEKVHCMVADVVTNAVSTLTLHTCEDAKTLVRMIVRGSIVQQVVDGVNEGSLVFGISPQGSNVVTTGVAADLDNPESKLAIVRHAWATGAQYAHSDFIIDSKGQRKLEEGDAVKLRHISAIANAFHMQATVTLIFKE